MGMTDEELIAHLREAKITQDLRYTLEDAAADRIEQLVATNKQLVAEIQDTEDRANAFATKEYRTEMRAKRAEAKLAKALDALQLASAELLVIGVMGLHRTALTAADKARAVLAELEKTNDR